MNTEQDQDQDKKSAPVINFIISFEIYPFDLMVSIGQTDEELTAALAEHGVTAHVPALIGYGINCPAKYAFWNKESTFLLRIHELPTTSKMFGALAHEICHIVSWALETLGFKLKCSSSGEAYAYLTGWITEKIYKQLNEHY